MTSTKSSNDQWLLKSRKVTTSDGVVDADNTGETLITALNYVTTGENYVDWKWRILNGFNATTTLEGKKTSIRHTNGVMFFERRELDANNVIIHTNTSSVQGYIHFPALLGGSDPSSLDDSEAFTKALVKFNQRAMEVSHKFQGGVFLGELAQTLHGIRHPAEALSKGLRTYNSAAKKLQKQYRKELLRVSSGRTSKTLKDAQIDLGSNRVRNLIRQGSKVISGLWLEGVFHWQPLVHDIDDAMKALADRYATKPAFQRVTAKAESNSVLSRDITGYTDGPWTWFVEVTQKSEISVIFRGAVGIQATDPVVPDAANWGFDLRSFIPTLWEVMPYSWLIDYFTNIGDVINGWSFGGHNVRWAATTVRKSFHVEDRTIERKLSLAPPGYVYLGNFSPSSTVSYRTSVLRLPYTGNFIPLATWRIPTSTRKLLNVSALIAQKLAGFL